MQTLILSRREAKEAEALGITRVDRMAFWLRMGAMAICALYGTFWLFASQ